MFGVDSTELLLIIVVAVVVIGPKDLPRALYKLGQIIGKGRAMTRHFRSGLDAMIREAELEELEKKWAAENARIMAEHPQESTDDPHGTLPAPAEPHAPAEQSDSTAGVSAEGVEQGSDVSATAFDAPASDSAGQADAPEQASREAKA